MKKNTDPISTSYVDIMEKNHMEIPWHDYTGDDSNVLISDAGLIEKASVIGRVGLILLSCGTGAWPYIHEQAFQRTRCNMHGRCRSDVH